MKKLFLMVAFAGFLFSKAAAQTKVPEWHNLNRESPSNRTQIILPQVKGFNVYKGDFHVHTSYSDGLLSPGGCVVDAWLDGLDILALTDTTRDTAVCSGHSEWERLMASRWRPCIRTRRMQVV